MTMQNVFLARPSAEWKAAYLDFYREWKDSGEEMVPWVISRDPEADFEQMVQWLHERERGAAQLPGWVPDSTFWLVAEAGAIIGAVNIRHGLSEFLLYRGGHIGYGIRPSERGKGYATRLLRLALPETRKLGIANALVVCDETNLASARTIIRNGGVPDQDFVEENGNVIKRYWINLEPGQP